MTKINLIVYGKIHGKGRPRFTRTGHTYTPQQTKDYEALIQSTFLQKYKNFEPLKTPLKLTVRAFFLQAKTNKLKHHTQKPDLDNIIKTIDSLNKLAFDDDKQIISITAEKYFSPVERLEIELQEII